MSTTVNTARPLSHSPSMRNSTRFSTYSTAPTLTPSIAPSHLSTESADTDSNKADPDSSSTQTLKVVHSQLARFDDPRLQNQRYVLSEGKADEHSKLALGAKLERALGRRMSGQDAVFTPKKAKTAVVA
ncbi:hypothetical protein K402DRAFT_399869 [Aulographum hederae CBS 113979]|uniref:Uncharacterized protein n=1 Tax=Aulographum hederae CBS 113979 TaxID=1176131 RepID=A0A6G1HFQ2_9PEZI|nr:hypothetical protein K402DRAFT_399869 [Aulographum hederae CBS 113979]